MNCKEVAKLVSESHDRRLSLFERLKVRTHLAMCVVCRRFTVQIKMIRDLARAVGRAGPTSLVVEGIAFDQSLSPQAKSRIKKSLRAQ